MNTRDEEMEQAMDPKDPLAGLAALKQSAPPGFVTRVMANLPAARVPRRSGWRRWWPEEGRWLAPALAGACVVLLVGIAFRPRPVPASSDRLEVHFELHAPAAQSVELVGDFTGWQTGALRLRGPDASGHWTADVELPAGRHEYIFLVDGREWVADPAAAVRRPDGFGRENAVMNL